jgi:glutamate N-acetyltransferase/amino-acid N-acetyltransferase
MSVTAAQGFAASGLHCGIRRKKPDLCIVRSLEPSVGGGMFTRNRVKAAPVLLNQSHLAQTEPQAIVANSGVANAATGERGKLNALATAAEAARLLELDAEQVLVLSTGVIGVQLPMGILLPALPTAVEALSPDGGADAAVAIMTTDTRPKEKTVECDGFTVGGMAKGSGMIHPDLATMLAVITTDYPLEPGEPASLLRPAVNQTFNSITIDGDCSTNDTVLLLANGTSGVERTAESDKQFADAVMEVCDALSRDIVADGEGATVLATITVSGAIDDAQARAIAQRIAVSPLVKTALFGHDPNWGRVLVAAGSAPYEGGYADLDPERVSLSYNGTVVLRAGSPEDVRPDVSGPSCTIDLDLGLGAGRASYLTSDLTYDYVRINAEYTT